MYKRQAVGIGEERHVADPRVQDLAHELDALGLELRARRRDVVDTYLMAQPAKPKFKELAPRER